MKINLSAENIGCSIGIFWTIGKRYNFNTIGITFIKWSIWLEFK